MGLVPVQEASRLGGGADLGSLGVQGGSLGEHGAFGKLQVVHRVGLRGRDGGRCWVSGLGLRFGGPARALPRSSDPECAHNTREKL